MARDPIVEDVRRVREAIAKEHGYDLQAIVRALQQQEAESGRQLVSLPPKPVPKEQTEPKRG